jgi:hypothetical protein
LVTENLANVLAGSRTNGVEEFGDRGATEVGSPESLFQALPIWLGAAGGTAQSAGKPPAGSS